MGKKSFFISTSIPYVNASPHMGFALEAVQTDVIARFRRILGEEVLFLSGTDDNALKNVQAAEVSGLLTKEYVGENAKKFKNLLERLNISNDDFIETSSDKRHFLGAQKLWSSCKPEDIYKKKYKGLYCVGCEEFKTEKDLVNGECEEHPGKKLEEVEEENYFFRLSNYQGKLLKIIESGELKIIPETRKNETISFIKSGLEDFSISRSKERARGWGVPVPNDDSQIMYVWFDALSNYINALGYGENGDNYEKFWVRGDERVHMIGKGINRFHTIYWPAMLLSAGVPLPTVVFVHGYITVGGQKMSKSVGNVIDPNSFIDEYGSEALRYFLIRKLSLFEDGDFTEEKFKEAYNSDLANGLGNLVSRILTMSSQYGVVAPKSTLSDEITSEFKTMVLNFRIDLVIEKIWKGIGDLDLYIQENEPFKKIKTSPEEAKENVLNLVINLYALANLLEPFMSETSGEIKRLIKENKAPEKPLFLRR